MVTMRAQSGDSTYAIAAGRRAAGRRPGGAGPRHCAGTYVKAHGVARSEQEGVRGRVGVPWRHGLCGR
jgi:hypothetical protein